MVLLCSQSSQGYPLSPEKSPSTPSGLPGPCRSRCTAPLRSHPSWVLPSHSSIAVPLMSPWAFRASCSFFLKYSNPESISPLLPSFFVHMSLLSTTFLDLLD